MPWLPILLATHIALAVLLLLPSIVLPFLLRRRGSQPMGGLTHALLAAQGSGSLVIGAGLAVTGAALIAVLGTQLLRQPWLLVALVLYAVNLLVAGLVSRPNLRRLAGIRTDENGGTWERRARQQRWVAYGMAAGTGVIGFLMMAKPGA